MIPIILASTITLDKTDYALTETASATINCAGNEKNQIYTVNWTNYSGTQVEVDVGDTGDCTTFLESFIINSSYIDAYGNGLNVTLTGTNLEGEDNATIVTAGEKTLLISSITHRGTFLGLSSSIDSNVADENDKAISGGLCDINVEDPSDDHVLQTVRSTMIDGNLDFIWDLDYERFKENKDYVGKISCFCGSKGSKFECINEDGFNVNNSIGSSDVAFRTSEWVRFHQIPLNTSFLNGTKNPRQNLFAGFNTINFITNASNNNPDNEPLEIRLRTFLVNNDTGKVFGVPNEGQEEAGFAGLGAGNTTAIASHLTAQNAVTGTYHITSVYDVRYKNQFQVAQYIRRTEDFNITSIQDTMKVNKAEVHDFFGAEVNLSVSTQSLSTLPDATNTSDYVVLAEAFNFDFCLNVNNTRGEDIEIFIHELTLENPTLETSELIISDEILGNQEVIDIEGSKNEQEFCVPLKMPGTIATHSDYRLAFDLHIGTESFEFECGDACEFEGHTDFFYIGKLEDMIEMPKFLTNPTATSLGNPGIFIVTERGQFLTMLNDVNYTAQESIAWGNATSLCTEKDSPTKQLCDYANSPMAGENIKVCFEGRNHFSDEVFIELSNIYLDTDVGDSQHILKTDHNPVEIGVKSISDNDLYNASAPSRLQEADGNLVDGYFTACTDWLILPVDLVGSNSWDVQGHATLDPDIYSLVEDKTWTWESDEFPIFGLFQTEPTWELHRFEPVHYRVPEIWEQVTNNRFDFRLNISALGDGSSTFNFGEHLPIRLLDENTPLERIVNLTISYANSSIIPYATSLSTQLGEIVLIIEDVNLSLGDNNFTITAHTFDFANRSTTGLERIANSAGTFDFVMNAQDTDNFESTKISGAGVTGKGNVLNRDVEVSCWVQGHRGALPDKSLKSPTSRAV